MAARSIVRKYFSESILILNQIGFVVCGTCDVLTTHSLTPFSAAPRGRCLDMADEGESAGVNVTDNFM
jgi:hypothetical protein